MTPASPPQVPASLYDETLVPWWRSFVFRFVGVFGLVVVVFVVAAVAWLDRGARQEVEDKFGLVLEHIAATVAPGIDGALIEAIDGDASPAFRTVREQLAVVAEVNGLREDQVYVLRPDGDQYAFVVMLQERTFVGDAYRPPPALRARYDWVTAERDAAHTGLYSDDNGTFISGLAPIVTADGRVTGILHVDYGVDTFIAEARQRTINLLLLCGLLIAGIALAGAWTHTRLRRKVVALLEGTRAIQTENYDHHVAIGGTDELASVATALNDVIGRLKERFEMLKFLPRHTRQMIELAAERGPVGLEQAQNLQLVVLESDIRGFTSLSARLTPEQTIGMLNQYIRAQAEIVSAAGGSIDKYMGDAVLAVFSGEGKERRAVRCALEIQRTMGRMNAEGAFEVPIHIGIGLATGEVVMGNLGSEERMEHTVIGPAVNLAARLCTAAGGDEVVVQCALYRQAALDDAPEGTVESVSAKGFADPVECVRLRVPAG